jgi:hypothetical protein
MVANDMHVNYGAVSSLFGAGHHHHKRTSSQDGRQKSKSKPICDGVSSLISSLFHGCPLRVPLLFGSSRRRCRLSNVVNALVVGGFLWLFSSLLWSGHFGEDHVDVTVSLGKPREDLEIDGQRKHAAPKYQAMNPFEMSIQNRDSEARQQPFPAAKYDQGQNRGQSRLD